MKVSNHYARISQYGDLLIPVELLDKVLSSGFIVRTSYNDGVDEITELVKITDVKIHSGDEVSNIMMHAVLSESSK